MENADILDGLSEDEIKALKYGPHGYQLEPGFEPVLDENGEPVVEIIPVPVVLCRSTKHPVEQWRFLSTFELYRGVVEVADRIFGGRLDVAGEPTSRIVVGRTDDFAEVAKELGLGHVQSFKVKNIAKLAAFLKRLVDGVKEVVRL